MVLCRQLGIFFLVAGLWVSGGCAGDPTEDATPEAVEPYDFGAVSPWYQCPTEPFHESVVSVTALDQAHHFFTSYDEGENGRTIEQQVELPTEGDWQQVGLWLELSCPAGGCDDWDRLGALELVLDPTADEPERLELARYATPFGVGMCKFIDVTHLASHLRGTQTLKSYIDTWVGPGHAQGSGWLLTAKFVYLPGVAPKTETINVWSMKEVVIGETAAGSTVADQFETVRVAIPADATIVEARWISTGHSFGNTLNCAEFCNLNHLLGANGTVQGASPWRRDCAYNPVQPQYGTWTHDRLGWCPGAVANPVVMDITYDVSPGEEVELTFDVRLYNGEEYVNTESVDWKPNVRVSLQILVHFDGP